ncbi:histidinol-phosphate transaminase [Streptomyces sp. NBC_00687]|uniref:pyridoxal phosphate-dependent aminotransferase n=1 Tax=Streptomyces sp. NBC_00687 TaxID=2975807 RepID=UPI002255BA59|nr:histidinol-phosphate transaminase [Streptomyces sp. NBC_00687]MCX4918656.1 histidinol-phosphate aminotransferase family protein [Streptomyces sp. NBC_00687]
MTAPAVARTARAAPLRLHLSESPYGPSPHALRAAHAAVDDTGTYPDPTRTAPARAIADLLGVRPEQVAVANGSDELVLLTALCVGDPGRPGVTTAGTFPGYRICLENARRGCHEVPLDGTSPGVTALADAMEGAGIAYVCNPHNPSGGALNRAELDLLVERAAATGTPLVVDEAYLDFAPPGTPQILDHLGSGAPVLALRTFSKAHGLAGLRIGYAVGDADLVARLREVQGTMPFSVNRAAQAAAVAALADREHLEQVRSGNTAARERFRAALAARGRHALPSVTNFLAVPVGDSARAERLLEDDHGILVRDAGRFGLAGHLRISVGPAGHLDRLLDALDAVDPVTHRRTGDMPVSRTTTAQEQQ